MRILVLIAVTAGLITGCNGGGNDAQVAAMKAHSDLADQFITALNATGTYQVSIAKTFTKENFIVIRDDRTGEYKAVNIQGYSTGVDANSFLRQTTVYNNLTVQPGYYETLPVTRVQGDNEITVYESFWREAVYTDRATGLQFEKISEVSKDLSSYAFLAQEAMVDSRAEALSERLGLEIGRAKEIVRLAITWKQKGGKSMSPKDQDAFSQELLGFSITEAKAAIKADAEGAGASLATLAEKAARANNITVEHVHEIIENLFN